MLTRVQDGQSQVSFVAGARHSSLGSIQPSTQWGKIEVHPTICHKGTWGVEVQHYSFCNLLSTCALPVLPTGITQHSLRRRLGGLLGQSGWVQKILPPWFQPQTVQPIVSFCTGYTILAYVQWIMEAFSFQGTVAGMWDWASNLHLVLMLRINPVPLWCVQIWYLKWTMRTLHVR